MAKPISKTANPKLAIVDYNVDHYNIASSKITFATNGKIQRIAIRVDITHTHIQDLVVKLKCPDGTEIYLHNRGDRGYGAADIKQTYNSESFSALQTFIGKASKGEWVLTVTDNAGVDSGTFNEWQLDLDIINTLQIKNQAYVSIPRVPAYNFGNNAFSVMAYVTPKKTEDGITVLKEGTIFSSKPYGGGYKGNGGWQLFLEKEGEDLMICFKTDDGNGYHLLKAPLNNLYDDKGIRNPTGAVADLAVSNALFKEYTHFVAAVRGEKGDMNLYVNGYLIARATPFQAGGTSMNTQSFQLKGIFKESIDKPNHFFTVKRDGNNYTVGSADWNIDAFNQIGNSFTMTSSNETILSESEKTSEGVNSIVSKIETVIPAKNMIPAERVSLIIKTPRNQQGKLLAQFAANIGPSENVDNSIALSIGRTEQYTNYYEGFVKHVSLWKTALSQSEIISYMDSKKSEKDNPNCVGFWKLEDDLNDSSATQNHGIKNGELEFVYQHQVLPVYVEEQQNEIWCWAASDLSIIEYYDPMSERSQKEIVDVAHDSNGRYMENNTRLLVKTYGRCAAPDYWKPLEVAVNNADTLFTTKFLVAPDFKTEIDFDILRSEINNGNPMRVGVVWWDTANKKTAFMGHVMVLTGIIQKDGNDFLVINDPWSGIIYIKIEDFANGKYPGNGYWSNADTTTSDNQLVSAS